MNFETFDVLGTMVSNGRLMTPAAVQKAIERRDGILGLGAGWCLCGDTKKSMFDEIGKYGAGVDIRLDA